MHHHHNEHAAVSWCGSWKKSCWSQDIYPGWWFGTCSIFPYIGLLIIPIDFHIFQRGGPTTNQYPIQIPIKIHEVSVESMVSPGKSPRKSLWRLRRWHKALGHRPLPRGHRNRWLGSPGNSQGCHWERNRTSEKDMDLMSLWYMNICIYIYIYIWSY